MRLRNCLLLLTYLLLAYSIAQCQLKDVPTQAEFDPILESADKKLKDFISTLTKYQAEAAEIDEERLKTDIHDFQTVREMIASAHSGKNNQGISLAKMVGILSGVDDASMEAAVWSNLITARVCSMPKSAFVYFALAVQDNGGMLREAGNQLFHPTFRMAVAADEVITAFADSGQSPNR